jgi:recombination DNA repair RAD52 pathway protein
MIYWKEINDYLNEKLDPKFIKVHPHNGFDYIEAHHAIQEANRVFGFDGWANRIIKSSVSCEQEGQDKYGNTQYEVCYSVVVEIEVRGFSDKGEIISAFRQGTATGSGFSKRLSDAHDSALKTAESDGIKRALKNFGNRFGLALYDDSREGVGANTTKEQVEMFEELSSLLKIWEKECWVVDDLKEKAESQKTNIEKMTDEQIEVFKSLYVETRDAILQKQESEEDNND